jgi:hypothetical protein
MHMNLFGASDVTSRILAVLACILFSSSLLAQSPADGNWDFRMSSPFGVVNAKVHLESNGNTLTGAFDLGDGRILSVEEGSVDGNTINFRLTRIGMFGDAVYIMSATVVGDQVDGMASAMGSSSGWSMTRAD